MWRDGIQAVAKARLFISDSEWVQHLNETADVAASVKRQYPRTEIASAAIDFEQAADHVLERLQKGDWDHSPTTEEAEAYRHISQCLAAKRSTRLEVSQYPYRMRISRDALEGVREAIKDDVLAGKALVDDRGESHVVVGCDDPTSAVFARLRDAGFEWIKD